MGYGIIVVRGIDVKIVQFGVIRLGKFPNHELKLKEIFDRVLGLLDEYHPDDVALEAPFHGKNVQSMLKLGRAQGVARSAGMCGEVPISEYAPSRVNEPVTGNGNASKIQVAKLLTSIFRSSAVTRLLDATDALAVDVCHHFQNGESKSRTRGWEAFIRK